MYIPTEAQEQSCLLEWARHYRIGALLVADFLISIPNGSVLAGDPGQRARQMNKLKATGLRVGAYDLFLAYPVPPFSGLWIEMKTQKGGQVSDAQERFGALMDIAGYKTTVCLGWEAAKTAIVGYLKGNA
jgi:hypothetical protein